MGLSFDNHATKFLLGIYSEGRLQDHRLCVCPVSVNAVRQISATYQLTLPAAAHRRPSGAHAPHSRSPLLRYVPLAGVLQETFHEESPSEA